MRFEEWKKTQDATYLCARHVWEAAQKIEREACAKVVEGEGGGLRGAMVAHKIRMRSNAPHEGPARASCAGPLDAVVMHGG